MANDLSIDWSVASVNAGFSGGLDGLANNSEATSESIDLGEQSPFLLTAEAVFDGTSASNTDIVFIFASWSRDNADFSDANNDEMIAAVTMNGTTEVISVFGFRVKGRYLKLRVRNESGDALLAGSPSANTMTLQKGFVDQA